MGPDHPDTLISSDYLANTLSELGEHRQAAELHQQNLAEYERVLGPDHHHPHQPQQPRQHAQRARRTRQAAELHQRTLADRERILGPDHPTPSPAATTSPTHRAGSLRLAVSGGGGKLPRPRREA
ncbi:tetratricopeptide repeat protein [Streptomyces sp. JV180]|uniref:tetratricopeptide repeat protein n=1 Tax=Streptomyces sp. JV180 TaxID=858634 RepID=UPI00295F1C0F|nr:tetratricopeptide repeat protein [Streptomyces sp. JV180]